MGTISAFNRMWNPVLAMKQGGPASAWPIFSVLPFTDKPQSLDEGHIGVEESHSQQELTAAFWKHKEAKGRMFGGRVLGKPLGEWVEELLMAQGSIKPRDTGLGGASESDMQVSALLSSHHCGGEQKGQERQLILMTTVLETFRLSMSKAFSFGFSL